MENLVAVTAHHRRNVVVGHAVEDIRAGWTAGTGSCCDGCPANCFEGISTGRFNSGGAGDSPAMFGRRIACPTRLHWSTGTATRDICDSFSAAMAFTRAMLSLLIFSYPRT